MSQKSKLIVEYLKYIYINGISVEKLKIENFWGS